MQRIFTKRERLLAQGIELPPLKGKRRDKGIKDTGRKSIPFATTPPMRQLGTM